MANKIKKISINAFEKVIKEFYEPTAIMEWNGLEIIVKYQLGLNDMLSLVDAVVNSCFGDDGRFLPEMKDFAIRNYVIEYYTNITLPSNVESRYALLYHSDINCKIMDYIDELQYNAIIKAINEKLAFNSHSIINNIVDEARDLFKSMSMLEGSLSKVVDGIDPEAIESLAKIANDGQINEENIVSAIMNLKSNEPELDLVKEGDTNE